MTIPSPFVIKRIARRAANYLRRPPTGTQQAIAEAFDEICKSLFSHPNPTIIRPLKGPHKGHWRYRLGDLRIIYAANVQEKTLEIIALGPRGDIY